MAELNLEVKKLERRETKATQTTSNATCVLPTPFDICVEIFFPSLAP